MKKKPYDPGSDPAGLLLGWRMGISLLDAAQVRLILENCQVTAEERAKFNAFLARGRR